MPPAHPRSRYGLLRVQPIIGSYQFSDFAGNQMLSSITGVVRLSADNTTLAFEVPQLSVKISAGAICARPFYVTIQTYDINTRMLTRM